jgi:uncharacterized protein involved in outer membrane biogenesis
MKKWTIRIGISAVVVLIVIVCVVLFSLNSIVKKGVEMVGPQVTRTDVKLGAAQISPFSGSGKLSDFTIGNPEGFSKNSAIKVGSIKLAVKPASLFSKVIQVDEINIQQPDIAVEGKLNGSNLGKIMDNLKAGGDSASKPSAQKPAGAKSEKNIYIKDLVVDGGKISVTLTALSGNRLSLPLPPIHLRDIGTPDKGVTMDEASRQILQQILEQAISASTQAAGNVGKDLKDAGSSAVNQAGKAVGGLKDLFKK